MKPVRRCSWMIALVIAAGAQPTSAGSNPPTFCIVNSIESDSYAPWAWSVGSYQTFAGTECEPMSIAEAYICKGAASIPEGMSAITVGDASKAYRSNIRIVARGDLPPDLKADCVPWTANVRYRLGLGKSVGSAAGSSTVQVIISTPSGSSYVGPSSSSINAHADTTIGGCIPMAMVAEKRASMGTYLRASVSLAVSNANKDGDYYHAIVVADPLITIDPTWASASLFKVEQEDALHPGTWSEVDRSWMNPVVFTADTPPALLQPGADGNAAWADYDNDGHLDLCVMNYNQTNVLLHNNGDGSFSDVTPASLVAVNLAPYVKWIDFDDDGLLDMFFPRGAGSGMANVLLRNVGGGSFADVTPVALRNVGFNRDAAWADYDRDGDLDVYLVSCFSGSRLMRQNADHTFTDVTPGQMSDSHCGNAGIWGDYDNDGWPDLYLVNGDSANRLFHNAGGTFTDVTATAGPVGDTSTSIGATWGDYDDDGRLDIYISNNGPDKLLHNEGGGVFADSTTAYTASGVNTLCGVFTDLNLDGNQDLYTLNNNQRSDLVFNVGDGRFEYGLWHMSGPGEQVATSLAVADYDEDGDPDLYFSRAGDNTMLRNDQALGNHWLEVDLRGAGGGVGSNRFGIGAHVRVVPAAGRAMMREVTHNPARYNGTPLRLHFGLGVTALVDTLEVAWPSGTVTRNPFPFTADRRVTVFEDGSIAGLTDRPDLPPRPVLYQNAPNPFNPLTCIRYELGAPAAVTLRVFDPAGRLVRTLLDGVPQISGRWEAAWDGLDAQGRACASGVYLYRLEAGGYAENGKMALLR